MTHSRVGLGGRSRPVWQGNAVRAEVTFGSAVGAPLPALTEVTITAKKPDASVVVGAVQPGDAPGEFYADFLADLAGDWFVRAECNGDIAAAEEGRFVVRPSAVIGG